MPNKCAPIAAVGATLLLSIAPRAATLPPGFEEEAVFQGLTQPTAVRFAPDGRVFVAQKEGIVKVFDRLSDSTPDVLADISLAVHSYSDRGLKALAVDPDFPTKPYVYVLYTYNFDPNDPGSGMPRWPDNCPDPPGGFDSGCVVSGRLSRLEVGVDNTLVGSEAVMLENNWCFQYPSHSTGDLVFGPHERVLYVSAGDGASFNWVDYGQGGGTGGIPLNPCGDPPGGIGGPMSAPTAEGGALRAQDLRTSGDPVGYGGTVLAIDPDTGAAWPENPLVGGSDLDDDRIVAYGMRQPFRMTVRGNTDEVWIGDVGWGLWEEINRVVDLHDTVIENFGWPCYEGADRQVGYDAQDLSICESLYTDTVDPATAPYYAYRHHDHVDPNPGPSSCSRTGSSSVTGLAFYSGSVYPGAYQGALFFADYSRECLFVMFPGADGLPDPATVATFGDAVPAPVDLQLGPDGRLYFADLLGGRIMRINYVGSPVHAVAAASPTNGPLPLDVQFNGSASTGDGLSYAWDLDGDGDFDDATGVNPTFQYTSEQQLVARLRVTDSQQTSDEDQVAITAGNTAPIATVLQPVSTLQWRVGQTIAFLGEASDAEDGPLPASAMSWEVLIHHCPEGTADCHVHPYVAFDGVDQGSFPAPDHEYSAFLEIVLTVADSGFAGNGGGILTNRAAVSIDPETVDLSFHTVPPGLALAVGASSDYTPFTRTVIIGSANTLTAVSPQGPYTFSAWSDGGAQSHVAIAPETATSYVASYECTGTCLSMETLTVTADGLPQTVPLGNSYTSPVVVCAAGYANNTVPVVPRVSNVTATSFDVRVQNPSDGPVVPEAVDCLVVEEGVWVVDGVRFEAQKYLSVVTDENNAWIGESRTYGQAYANPVVLGQVMSENDPDWSAFWSQGATRFDPPSGTVLRTGKMVGEDPDVTRTPETLGVVVFEAGHGTLFGVEYEAALGPDTVLGVADAPPYAYAFGTPFPTAPQVAIHSRAGCDGGDGGWSVTYGPAPLTATALALAIDEDQLGDAERRHGSEQIGYVVFAQPFAIGGTPCAGDADCDDGDACNGVETCQVGTCAGGTAVTCTDGNACTADSCDPADGSCSFPPHADGTSCDDGDLCNGLATCVSGSCTAGAPVSCTDANPCTTDGCTAVDGTCVHVPVTNGTPCDDGDLCNGVATCQAGTCAGGTPVSCDDGVPCTVDACNPNDGSCSNTPVTLANDPAVHLYARLEEAAGTRLDSSGRGNDLAAFGAPAGSSDSREGVFGLDLDEASQQYLERPSSGAAVPPGEGLAPGFPGEVGGASTDLSIAAWVKPKTGGNHPLVVKDAAGQRSYGVWLWDFGSGMVVDPDIYDPAGQDFAQRGVADLAGTTVLPVGQWHHVVYTYEGTTGTSRVYLDGVLDAGPFAENMSSYFTGTAPLSLGRREGVGPDSDYADVLLDEVLVLDRAIGPDEAMRLFQQGAAAAAVDCAVPPGPPVEAMGLTVGGTRLTVPLGNSYASPVVVCAAGYANNTVPVVPRVSNVTATSFDVRVQNPSDGPVVPEAVDCLVVEEGVWVVDGVKFEAQKYLSVVTDENNAWIGEPRTYGQAYANPVVLGQVMSENDPDWSAFWSQGATRFDPPSGTVLRTGKMVGEDPDVTRTPETLGVVVFEAGHGTLFGVEYEAALGPDTVLGIDDAPPYAYAFGTPFPTAPQLVLHSRAGCDGGDGGWSTTYGPAPLTATALALAIDEDQLGDTERRHGSEQIGYVVFAQPFVLASSP